ncbi:hypothetical protein ABTX61_20245 [Amycolatopsis japonica]
MYAPLSAPNAIRLSPRWLNGRTVQRSSRFGASGLNSHPYWPDIA